MTVDATPAPTLGVLSQGEMHALALSMFLPRAALDESPFRFLVIDSPVWKGWTITSGTLAELFAEVNSSLGGIVRERLAVVALAEGPHSIIIRPSTPSRAPASATRRCR